MSQRDGCVPLVRSALPESLLLFDTYDTLEGVSRVCGLARELGDLLQGEGGAPGYRRPCRSRHADAEDAGRGRTAPAPRWVSPKTHPARIFLTSSVRTQ